MFKKISSCLCTMIIAFVFCLKSESIREELTFPEIYLSQGKSNLSPWTTQQKSKSHKWLKEELYKKNTEGTLTHPTGPNVEPSLKMAKLHFQFDYKNLEGTVLLGGFGSDTYDSKKLFELMPHTKIIGVEWVPDLVSETRKKLENYEKEKRIHLFTGDLRDLNELWGKEGIYSVRNQTIDLVFLNGVIDLYDQERATADQEDALLQILSEARRILKDGGILIIGAGYEYLNSRKILESFSQFDIYNPFGVLIAKKKGSTLTNNQFLKSS